ncbi:TetR/AcrR family transcriptional regulator [Clostridium sp. JN-9]|uniref:TetR/AcrR family transcriptional regulator n=1 Tax=Clostridium sp. JN-9 TaxID=2507159 RepID=UPI000FFE24F2|nr:TetR/AcrR family transcriptional regulator [Clostridium sp. JN-9]QAT40934.1 TetR/AcrR family transcriptional regulator [Clostridium sp. JN-9]
MNVKKIKTKDKIIKAAWKLFVKQGYEKTTISEIIEVSQTSRGTFYHHFRGKEDLLFSLAYFFDNDYTIWEKTIDPYMNSLDILLSFDAYVLKNLENSPYRPFLSSLYGLQVMTSGTRHILDPSREYYKIIAGLMKEGIEKNEIKSSLSYMELTEAFAIIERGLTYDWCLNKGRYSLLQYGQRMMKIFLNSIKA